MGTYNTSATNNDVFLVYGDSTWKTGANLGRYLDCVYGSDMPDRRPEYLIRWGTSSGVTYVPSEETINYQSAISENTDKLDSLRQLERAGVPVPSFTTDPSEAAGWLTGRYAADVVFGRESNHYGGQDIELVSQADVRHSAGSASAVLSETGSDFFTEGIPVDTEYRVHVFNGDMAVVRTKEQREEPSEDAVGDPEWVRNYENGYRFVYPDSRPAALAQASAAVHALNLDFGAVDLIIAEDGSPYVLEVNTAPSLDRPTMETYAKRLAEMVGIAEGDAAGFRNTNLYDDEDEDWDEGEVNDMWGTPERDVPDGGSVVTDSRSATETVRSLVGRGP